MAERSAILAVPDNAAEPGRQAPPQPEVDEERAAPEQFEVARVPLFGGAGVDDDDAERARQTARLIREIGPALGLDPHKLRIVVNDAAAAATGTRRAAGLELHGVIQLYPRFDPKTVEGRYLLGHELAHAAQRGLTGADADVDLTELEAEEVGRAVARGEEFEAPAMRLGGGEPAAADTDVKGSLEDTVKVTRKREIDRIKKALKHIFWISDADIDKALLTLTEMDFFTARAVVRSLEPKERYWLVDNIDSHHYKRFRAEIFACYAALTPAELGKFDERLLIKMDLHELTPEEHFAALYVVQHLKAEALAKLQDSPNGPAIKAVVANKPELEDLEKQREAKAQKEEEQKQQAEGQDKAAIEGDQQLQEDIQAIKDRMSDFFISDAKALAALDRAAKYNRQPDKMQALAHALDDGALDTLINELPVKALFEEIHKETDKAGKPQPEVPRRKAFLMLLSNRPAYKNVEKAEELTSLGLLDWAVTDEDAYLAFQLIKSVPPKSRESFMLADDGERWKKTLSEMTPEMRHSESLNFYGGGKGKMDKASIEAPLLDGSLWVAERLSELDGRIRMAIAAGDHEFVFEESRRKKAHKEPGLKPVVDKYRLYDPAALGPDGKPAPRTEYSGELLKGTSFWEEGPFATAATIGRGLSLAGTLTKTYSGGGAKHLSVGRIQELMGGDVVGARFKSDEEVQAEEKKTGKSLGGGNFLDKVEIDLSAGLIKLEAKVLSLASLRYFFGDTLIQSGEGRLEDVSVRAGYPKSGAKAYFMQVRVGNITLKDILLTSTDSITAVNAAAIEDARLYSASEHVDTDKQNEQNTDNWFEWILARTPIFSRLLGLVRLGVNYFNDDLTKAFSQTAEFGVSAKSIVLTGVTMSNGEHIESIELGRARIGKGEQIDGYRSALEASLATFPNRIKAEEAAVAQATVPEDKAAHQRSLERLNEQKARVEKELAQVKADQARIAKLEARKKAGTLTGDEERELANLKRGGTALDIETVTLKGISGRAAAGDLSLRNVHGQGRLSQFVEGSDARPFLKSQEAASTLSVDIGDIKAKDLALKKSPPSAETLERKIKSIQDKLGDHAPDFRTAEKLAKLKQLLQDVTDYEKFAKRGAANLEPDERDRFAELRKKLYEETARAVGEIDIEGASIDLDFTGGLSSLADLRKTLKSASLSGKSVNLKDVTIPGTGFHADAVSATGPRLTITPGDETKVGFSAAEIIATGLRLQRTREDLEEQVRQLSDQTLSPAKQQRLAKIQDALADLDRLTARAEEDERALKAAKGTLGEAKAQQKVDADKQAFLKWQDRLVAQRVSVKSLDVSAKVVGNLLSDEFDSDDLSAGITGKFAEAEVTGAEAGPVSAKAAKITGAEGTVQYQPDKIEITDFRVAAVEVTGLRYSGGLKEIASSEVTTLTGIRAKATIAYEKGPSGDVLATTASIESLRIDSIAAQNLHYEDSSGKQKLTVDVPSGSLHGVALTDFSVTIPDDPDGEMAYTGKLDVKAVEKFKILAQVQGGLMAKGTIDASNLKVDFLKDGEQTINIGELDVSEGEVQKDGTRAKFKVTKLSGEVKRKKDGTTEFAIPIENPIEKIEVASLRWKSADRSIVANQPVVLSGISVTGSMHQNQATKDKEVDQVQITKLHVNSVTGNDLTYTDGDTTFRITKDDPAQKDPATALRIDGIDLVGLTWKPHQKITIENLDVPHMAASFAAEVKSSGITAGGVVKADGIHLKLLRGGKLVAKVDDLNAQIHGKAGGADFKASVAHMKTAVSADGDTVTLDPLTIQSISVTHFAFSTPDVEIDLPEGAGDVTFHDLDAKITVNLNPTPKPGSVPPGTSKPPLVKSIVVDSLVIPTTTGTGFTITLPSLGGLKLSVAKGTDFKLGKLELLGPTKGGPFTIENKSGVWNTLGKVVLTDADIQKLGFEVAGSVKGSGKLHAEGGSLEFTAAGKKIDVNRVTVEELEAVAGSGTFKITRGTGASAFPGAAAGAGAELKGIHVSEKGDVAVDEVSATGLTYDDPSSGLHLDFHKITLPKGVKKESGKPVHIPHVDLNEATFSLDVAKLSGGGSGSSGTSLAPSDYDFLDKLTGHVNSHVVVDLVNVPIYGTLHRDIPFLVDINRGAINYERIQSNFPFPISSKLKFDFDKGTGVWQVRQSGEATFETTVPAAEREAAKKQKTIRLAVLVNGHSVTPPVTTGGPILTDLVIQDVDVLLRMDAPADIKLGSGGASGTINLHSVGKKGALEFTARAPGRISDAAGIALHLSNLEASVSKLKLGGAKLDAASIAIDEVTDTQMHFTQTSRTEAAPGILSGRIVQGSADNIDLDLGGGAGTPTPTPGPKKGTP
ncbi:MAG: DUF4157 domain-containing protein [Bryobacteraceae bacterium]|jgi:hypothetical protein